MTEKKFTNCFIKNQKFPHLDANVRIVDIFYEDTNTQILRPILSEDRSGIQNQRKSIVNETKSLQELEEVLSLEDLKMLKRVFQASIRQKIENFNDNIHYNISQKEQSLNMTEFIEALMY